LYPEQSQTFLKEGRNKFTNPVGFYTKQAIEAIIENLIKNEPLESFLLPLENIIQIRAVQDFTPSQSVGFIFLIKKVVYDTIHNDVDSKDMIEFLSKIDSLALVAFDIFMKYKERIYEIKAKELLDRTWWLLKKHNIISEITDNNLENLKILKER